MRFIRFLIKEIFFNGIIFIFAGTFVLSLIYLISIGSSISNFFETFKEIVYFLLSQQDSRIGFTTGEIILSGAKYTLPLALLSLLYVVLLSLCISAIAVTVHFLNFYYEAKIPTIIYRIIEIIISLFSTIPLFVSFWLMYILIGSNEFLLPLIALCVVLFGGILWDITNYLKTDMLMQIEQTHAIVYSTMGKRLGMFFPVSNSYSGYLFSSSLPRFLPYLAGKVPAIIGSVTIAEIAFDFPGLGKNLIDALIYADSSLLVDSVFILLTITSIVSFLVKLFLFFIYPRVYEKSM